MHNSLITTKPVAQQQNRMLQSSHKFRAGESQEQPLVADGIPTRPQQETMRHQSQRPMMRHPL
jgi:hypothetical protein